MPAELRPRLRPLEILSVGPEKQPLFLLRDPEAFGEPVVLPAGGTVLAMLMDGRRTLAEIQSDFHAQTRVRVALVDLEAVIRELDRARLLANERFERHRRKVVGEYLAGSVRPASHAGGAYSAEAEELRRELDGFFTAGDGPGPLEAEASRDGWQLRGLVSPHIDPHRGGPVFAWAYREVAARCDADRYVILGTAHNGLNEWFSVSRKDFDTPLGVVPTDREFIDRLAEHLASSVAGGTMDLFADELAHRSEHSIEFQVVFLQHVLGGRRPFKIVPVLVNSFHELLSDGQSPEDSPQIQAFVAGVRAAAAGHSGEVCYISAADFAHVGRRFGDPWLLDPRRLADQEEDDRKLLELVGRCDAPGFFAHVAAQLDRRRICGLAPTYTLLEIIQPNRGELLKYSQAVEEDGTACVSFASMAFYREE
jgi:AmmeMemoRadiSam system protein B